MGENTKAVFVGVDGVKAFFGFLKDIGVTLLGFEVGAELGGLRQNGQDPFKLGVRDADVVFSTARLGNLGTAHALVVDGTDGLPVQADNVSRFRGCSFSFQWNLDSYSTLLEFRNLHAYDDASPVLARLVQTQG